MTFPTITWVSYAVLLAFQAADVLSTMAALARPNVVEGNSFVRQVMGALGTLPGMIVSKGLVMAGIAAGAWYAPSLELLYVMGALAGWYGRVVLVNYQLSRKP